MTLLPQFIKSSCLSLIVRSVIVSSIITSSVMLNTALAAEKTENDIKPSFSEYIVQLKEEAIAKGFEEELLETSFANVKFHQRAVKADRSQPENVETLDTYLPKRVTKW